MALFQFLNVPGLDPVSDPLPWLGKPSCFTDFGGAISCLLPYLFLFGGIILLGMLIAGGFDLMIAQGNEEKVQKGATKIKNALIGYLLLFGVYWLAQIVQVLFRVPIL